MRKILNPKEMESSIKRLAEEIVARGGVDSLALVGMRTRGVPLARRLKNLIDARAGDDIPIGAVDITLYRDDFRELISQPKAHGSEILFDVARSRIVLVDDVLYTGRTVRAAIDEIMDFGRPAKIELAVMTDRGGRELPIAADYVGLSVDVAADEYVEVRFAETDGEDGVYVITRTEK